MNEKLEAIRDASAASFHKLFTEALPDIESAMVAAASEADNQEQEAKLSIGFTVKLNLDKNAIQYRLSFGVKHCLDACEPMPDPNQPALPGTDEDLSMTITTGDKSVTLSGDDFSKACKRIDKLSRTKAA